jgi:ABC-type phosphate/phosphonate transport system substrate-binding protein
MRPSRLAALIVPIAVWTAAVPAVEPAPQSPVRIGMLGTMFRDVKPAIFAALAQPFHSLVQSQTGLKSELTLVQTPDELREQLNSGKLQFGVFHGFEFAWMKQKTPTLQPLMLAAPQHRPLRGLIVVSKDNPATSLADLKGKVVALPQGTREYARLFITRQCQALGQSPDAYFAQVTNPAMPDTALHEVVDDKVSAAIVDGATLQGYAERYSGRWKRLKALVTSENFPESVVVYRPGMVDDATIQRFKQGMGTAHTSPMGRQLLSLWNMAGFQPVPANYQQQLDDIVKTYPAPVDEAK